MFITSITNKWYDWKTGSVQITSQRIKSVAIVTRSFFQVIAIVIGVSKSTIIGVI